MRKIIRRIRRKIRKALRGRDFLGYAKFQRETLREIRKRAGLKVEVAYAKPEYLRRIARTARREAERQGRNAYVGGGE